MTIAKEKKIRKGVIDLLKSKKNHSAAVDGLLIDELIDFLKISEFAKGNLETNPDNWQALTTVTMASKQIQSILAKLDLTPQERNRKLKWREERVEAFDLQKFLNEN
jgi:hypothetical protein